MGRNRPRHIHMNAPKIRIVQKKNNFRDDEIRIRICQLFPKTPEIVRIYFRWNSNDDILQLFKLVFFFVVIIQITGSSGTSVISSTMHSEIRSFGILGHLSTFLPNLQNWHNSILLNNVFGVSSVHVKRSLLPSSQIVLMIFSRCQHCTRM